MPLLLTLREHVRAKSAGSPIGRGSEQIVPAIAATSRMVVAHGSGQRGDGVSVRTSSSYIGYATCYAKSPKIWKIVFTLLQQAGKPPLPPSRSTTVRAAAPAVR